jgi:hypothetical protein
MYSNEFFISQVKKVFVRLDEKQSYGMSSMSKLFKGFKRLKKFLIRNKILNLL